MKQNIQKRVNKELRDAISNFDVRGVQNALRLGARFNFDYNVLFLHNPDLGQEVMEDLKQEKQEIIRIIEKQRDANNNLLEYVEYDDKDNDEERFINLISEAQHNVIITHYGKTPLMYAAGKGYKIALKILIERGADPDLVDKDGNTALLVAAREWSFRSDIRSFNGDIIRTLAKVSSNLNVVNIWGDTVLKKLGLIGERKQGAKMKFMIC